MKYEVELRLRDFQFWAGAKANAEKLTSEQLDVIEDWLEGYWCETPTETEINNLMWFEFDWICEAILEINNPWEE